MSIKFKEAILKEKLNPREIIFIDWLRFNKIDPEQLRIWLIKDLNNIIEKCSYEL